MSETWAGSPFENPSAQRIGRWIGLLFDQPFPFQEAVQSVRAQRKSWQPGYMPLSNVVELTMANDTKITGTSSQETASLDTETNEVCVILTQWDGPFFTWATVTINGVEIQVEAWMNPAEPRRESQPRSPMVVTPAPDPED
ncbi:hypothetical protein HZA87_04150 [Candidatus Uhrbacteria bacterium]|nr:hypothetical protein [Candidatus Uhrbacteria bacterium]